MATQLRGGRSYKEALTGSGSQHSIFVEGFPERASWIWLRNMFREVGNVTDVFMSRRRSRFGNKFAFVRFKNKWEVEEAVKVFNGRLVAGKRLQTNFAQDKTTKRRQVWIRKNERGTDREDPQDKESVRIKEAAGSDNHVIPFVEAEPDKDILKRLEHCIVGTSVEEFEVDWLLKRFQEQGWHELWISKISDWKFVIGFCNGKLKEDLQKNDWGKIRKWFEKVEPWSLSSEMEEREETLCIRGLPLMLWNKRNLERISGIWGKICSQVKHNPGDARKCFVPIRTTHKSKSEGAVELRVMGTKYVIGISEAETTSDQGTEPTGKLAEESFVAPFVDKIVHSKLFKFVESFTRVSETKTTKGLALIDIVREVTMFVFKIKMPSDVRVQLINDLADIEYRLSFGCSDKLQLGSVIAAFTRARSALVAAAK